MNLEDIYVEEDLINFLNNLSNYGTVKSVKKENSTKKNDNFWYISLNDDWQNISNDIIETLKNIYYYQKSTSFTKNWKKLKQKLVEKNVINHFKDINQYEFYLEENPIGLHISIEKPKNGKKVIGKEVTFTIDEIKIVAQGLMGEPAMFNKDQYCCNRILIKVIINGFRNNDNNNNNNDDEIQALKRAHISIGFVGVENVNDHV
eukprot:TRINITY_DN1918_c2_g1_i1.p1 TRINITY_DN1918_c2_g1~~TRINITY_DN1918_c2_g1_i1.p1  ORF type:complete len:204 (+),score=52.38 TRINITY_DN1918_c2_g1_i1:52-663(+)